MYLFMVRHWRAVFIYARKKFTLVINLFIYVIIYGASLARCVIYLYICICLFINGASVARCDIYLYIYIYIYLYLFIYVFMVCHRRAVLYIY